MRVFAFDAALDRGDQNVFSPALRGEPTYRPPREPLSSPAEVFRSALAAKLTGAKRREAHLFERG